MTQFLSNNVRHGMNFEKVAKFRTLNMTDLNKAN